MTTQTVVGLYRINGAAWNVVIAPATNGTPADVPATWQPKVPADWVDMDEHLATVPAQDDDGDELPYSEEPGYRTTAETW
jgi:hypothetical protein